MRADLSRASARNNSLPSAADLVDLSHDEGMSQQSLAWVLLALSNPKSADSKRRKEEKNMGVREAARGRR